MLKNITPQKLLIVALFVILSAFDIPTRRGEEITKNIEIFASVYAEVNKHYVDEVNPNTLMKVGLDAMLAYLDPYTNYISEDRIEDYRLSTTGKYGGIGATIGKVGDNVVILMPYEEAPAFNAGLRRGDAFYTVDGIDVTGKSVSEVVSLLKGESGKNLTLEVKRYGVEEPVKINVSRENIKLKNVPYYGMVTSSIGMIQLTGFMYDAADEVKNAFLKLKEQGAKKIIIDLRSNPGGLLFEAKKICNFFIPKDKVVVDMRGKTSDAIRTISTDKSPIDLNIPIAVLVNGRSASASEIVSGVIQDYDRGIVIGQRTFGKGLVQNTFNTTYKTKVKVTTAKYYIPSGRCIQEIDYSKKLKNGALYKTPDSLRVYFKTQNGRVVLDGGGVLPDIKTPVVVPSDVVKDMFVQNMFFLYANHYCFKNEEVNKPGEFKLSDKDFQAYKEWLNTQEYEYKSSAEKKLDEFYTDLKKDSLSASFEYEVKAMRNKIKTSQASLLEDSKSQILEKLEEEIIGRYYLNKGQIEASFTHDNYVLEAVKILNDEAEYQNILK